MFNELTYVNRFPVYYSPNSSSWLQESDSSSLFEIYHSPNSSS